MSKIIGISSGIRYSNHSYFCNLSYDVIKSVIKYEKIVPFILPNFFSGTYINKVVNHLDGLILTGGTDVDPTYYGEQPLPELGEVNPLRDKFEIEIAKIMIHKKKPVLGICRGLQVINIAKGGTLYQDVHRQIDSSLLQHRQKSYNSHPTHHISITDHSLLHKIVNKSTLKVNSRHHQAVKDVGDGLRVSAKASDGIVEAIEGISDEAFILGVQWHPENMSVADDKDAQQIFKKFVSVITNNESEN